MLKVLIPRRLGVMHQHMRGILTRCVGVPHRHQALVKQQVGLKPGPKGRAAITHRKVYRFGVEVRQALRRKNAQIHTRISPGVVAQPGHEPFGGKCRRHADGQVLRLGA